MRTSEKDKLSFCGLLLRLKYYNHTCLMKRKEKEGRKRRREEITGLQGVDEGRAKHSANRQQASRRLHLIRRPSFRQKCLLWHTMSRYSREFLNVYSYYYTFSFHVVPKSLSLFLLPLTRTRTDLHTRTPDETGS